MKDKLQDVINAMTADVAAIVQTIMNSGQDAPSVKELRDKARKDDIVVRSSPIGNSGRAVIEVFYDSLLEWDRQPRTGRWPSMSEIKEWAQAKGLPTDNGTLNIIRRSIWWNGHSGMTLETALEKEIEQRLEKNWSQQILEALSDHIDELLK